MSSTVSPPTGKALRKLNELLESFFDEQNGMFKGDYSDDKISKETGLSVSYVRDYRIGAFGKLKPPSEFHSLQSQIRELETLYLQTDQAMKEGLKDLKAKMANMQRKFD